jgi:hypothetical protein
MSRTSVFLDRRPLHLASKIGYVSLGRALRLRHARGRHEIPASDYRRVRQSCARAREAQKRVPEQLLGYPGCVCAASSDPSRRGPTHGAFRSKSNQCHILRARTDAPASRTGHSDKDSGLSPGIRELDGHVQSSACSLDGILSTPFKAERYGRLSSEAPLSTRWTRGRMAASHGGCRQRLNRASPASDRCPKVKAYCAENRANE